METLRIKCTLLILIYRTAFATLGVLKILRIRQNVSDGWERGTDKILIPFLLCGQSGVHSLNCTNFNAKSERSEHCHCSCPNESATLLFAAGEWKCVMNSKVRELLDFDGQRYAFFQHESNDRQLRLLGNGDNRRVSLKKSLGNCAVDAGSSWFIGCDGVVKGISSSVFKISQGSNKRYHLKVTSNAFFTRILKGKIMKVSIHCTSRSSRSTVKRKLLFKFDGALNCFISVPISQASVTTTASETAVATATTSKSTPSMRTTLPVVTAAETTYTSEMDSSPIITNTTASVFTTPSIISDGTHSVSKSPPTTSYAVPFITDASMQLFHNPSTVTISTPTISIITPTTSIATPTLLSIAASQSTVSFVQSTGSEMSSVAFAPTQKIHPGKSTAKTDIVSNVPTKPFSGRQQSRSENGSPSFGIISGIVASSLLIILIIVGLLLYRHGYLSEMPCSRNKREEMNSASQTKTVQKPDGDDLYKELTLDGPPSLYASTYEIPNPAYTDETLGKEKNQSHQVDVDDHFYASLNIQQGGNIYGLCNNQDINARLHQNYGSICIEQPVYSLLEELTVRKATKDPTQEGSEPMYSVLEEPDLEPSEGPNQFSSISSEQPVYNTLESPSGSGEDPKIMYK